MYDAFSKAATVSPAAHRKLKKSNSAKFSPSYGVHRGLIKDPNWPPAEFPETGTAMSRRNRRVVAKFNVMVDGAPVSVEGDLSLGGAMFTMPTRLGAKSVVLELGGYKAQAEVLSASKKGNTFAHHCRFVDVNESRPLWDIVKHS